MSSGRGGNYSFLECPYQLVYSGVTDSWFREQSRPSFIVLFAVTGGKTSLSSALALGFQENSWSQQIRANRRLWTHYERC